MRVESPEVRRGLCEAGRGDAIARQAESLGRIGHVGSSSQLDRHLDEGWPCP